MLSTLLRFAPANGQAESQKARCHSIEMLYSCQVSLTLWLHRGLQGHHAATCSSCQILAQLVEQRPRAFEVLCVETFGEPAVDWR
jgi:hypothetical protein